MVFIQPPQKQIMKAILLSIILTISLICSIKAQYRWSSYEVTKIKAEASKAGVASMKLSEEDAMVFADCVFLKASSKYPNIKSMPEEFVKRIAYECGLSMKIGWSKAVENKMLEVILSAKEMKIFAEEYRIAFAECIVSGIKLKYPNGITLSEAENIAKKYGSQIGRDCFQEITKTIN